MNANWNQLLLIIKWNKIRLRSPHIPLYTLLSPLEAPSIFIQYLYHKGSHRRSLYVFRLSNRLVIPSASPLLFSPCYISNFEMMIERKRISGKREITKERGEAH